MSVPFHIPSISGAERGHLDALLGDPVAVASDGRFSRLCADALSAQLGLERLLFTPSCTAALEMAAMLTVRPGDEVLVPSFTFVTSVSSFVSSGATPVFCDIREDTLNIDERQLESLVTEKTRAIVAVHYGGVACAMDSIMALAAKRGLYVIEDAAQALSGRYRGRALGGIGDLGCFSFHSTKNYQCGEGGALAVNDAGLLDRAEVCRDKGTNRRAFFRGQTDKYTWVDRGSSYVPSEVSMAFLAGQLSDLAPVRERRKAVFERYMRLLEPLAAAGRLQLPVVPADCEPSFHLFHVLTTDEAQRDGLLTHLTGRAIGATFHYVPLHSSPVGSGFHDGRPLPVTDSVAGRLLRLPLYPTLSDADVERVCEAVFDYFGESP